jgi:hypothetical protein
VKVKKVIDTVGIIMLEMQGDEMIEGEGLQSRWVRNHAESMGPHGNMVSRT